MRRTAIFILSGLAFAAAFAAGVWYARSRISAPEQKDRRKILYWIDPMHPAYKSDQPGVAPDCGMKLVPVYEDGAARADSTPARRKILYYRDPRDPSYRSDKPGLNPETGNELEPVYEDANRININVQKQQLIGVTYAVAELSSGIEAIPAVGRIAQDETRITRVHPKIEGWIEKVFANFTGQLVRQGDPLLTIYSPEMFAAQQEFMVALRARDIMKSSSSREAYENSELLIEAARRRLELWDLSAAQISEIERTRKAIRTVTLYAPATGYITSRNAFPSQRVSPDTELYAIADLSRVWILADVFETDLSKIHTGQSAVVSIPTESGRKFTARVAYIQPQIDSASRTLKIRLEAPNPDLRLKPEMFITLELRVGLPRRVTVPADAVLNTGLSKSVFVDLGEGALERREVQTGDRIGDRIQVISGLRPGERVVASGAFLIDSEAHLKGGGQ
jgi:RND family efflux transporter MFP subunit